jgi:hypothetical protein
MEILHHLRLRFSPPRIADPQFGNLLFMFIRNAPKLSYWECEWEFPITGEVVSISLPGEESGPSDGAREFYLSLPARYEQILAAARPRLEEVFKTHLRQTLPDDFSTVLKLAGFGLDDVKPPFHWDISFETTGDKWLGITIPFIGDTAETAVVDT